MKKLFFILLAVVCLAGCASAPFVSAPPPNPPGGQVVILKHRGCIWNSGNTVCKITIKNIGTADVKNVRFKFALQGNYKGYWHSDSVIDYLPSKETMELAVAGYDTVAGMLSYPLILNEVVVDSFEIVDPR